MTAPELTKLTVNLLPRSVDALNAAADHLGDTKTDTINRALQVYGQVTNLNVGERLTFDHRVDDAVTLLRTSRAYSAARLAFGALLIVLAFVAGVASPW